MIDSLTILLTTLAVLYMLLRARDLDRSLPWFETEDTSLKEPGNKAKRSPLAPHNPKHPISNETWQP